MESKLILLKILDEIKDVWQFKLEGIDNRKTLQKLIYFFQELGGTTKYRYNLYVRGPYSPDLAKDAFGIPGIDEDIVKLAEEKILLKDEDCESIHRLKIFVNGFDSPLDLEILSTMHYLYNHAYMPKRTKEAIFREFKSQKPIIAQETDLERYWQKLLSEKLVEE